MSKEANLANKESSGVASALPKKKQDIKKLESQDYPKTIKEYISEMLSKFNEVDSKQYPVIDRQIGDVFHQVYKSAVGGTEPLAKAIFAVIDADLGTKKTPLEAKNYKKILSAI